MTTAPIDAQAFRDFERAAHSEKASSYTELFAAITDRAIAPLLDAVHAGEGTRLVDVACGPGRLVRAAAERGAKAIGVDLAPAMIGLARERNPDLEFHESGAEAMPFDGASFDAATCAFGMGHFPEPERVAAEIARVLRPGGIAAFSWWESFTCNRINGVFHETLAALKVSAPGVLPPGPPMDRFSDRERFAEFLTAAAFTGIAIEHVTFSHRLRDADQLWNLAMGSFARASAMIRAQDEATRRAIRAAVSKAAQAYATDGGLDIPVAFLVVSGTKV